MNNEEIKNKQELKAPQESGETSSIQETPEALSQKMTEQSQKEVSDFQTEGEKGIGDIEKNLEGGLVIDESDKADLKTLNQEADVAKNELVAEIGNKDESKEKISAKNQSEVSEKDNIVEIAKDDNFEGSIIIKTKDAEGRISGYAIRKNSHGDLEGNKIGYMENGEIGWVQQLHDSDFDKMAQDGILKTYEKEVTRENEPSKAELREFSKKYSKEDRDHIAKEIWDKRKKHLESNKSDKENDQEMNGAAGQLETLKSEIESNNDASFNEGIKDFLDNKSESITNSQNFEEIRKIILDFYTKEKEEWEARKENIKENFSEHNLSSLSMEDYVKLLQEFPGHLVTHVTRQGVRDQTMPYHYKGQGEMKNGFKNILESKKLQSPLATAISESKSFHDICKFLNGGDEVITFRDTVNNIDATPTNPARLMNRFKNFTYGKINEDYHDKAAIHFGIKEVLNSLYGGEKGNDIFVIYPSAHIASQYNFFNKYDGKSLAYSGDGFNNDLYVWAKNEEKGMSIDAGVVFIPENVQVDRKTGSQYEINQQGNPTMVKDIKTENNDSKFKKSENTISSREYWEQYFSENQGKRPSKIVYYDANMTPTEALNDWKAKNNIVDDAEEKNFGFDKNNVSYDFKRPGGNVEVAQFRQLAFEALRNEFPIDMLAVAYDSKFFNKSKEEQEGILFEMQYG